MSESLLTKEEQNRLHELQKRPQYIVPIGNCIPNSYNENKMNKTRLEALKEFIKLKGQIGDIVVRPQSSNHNFSKAPTVNDKFIIVDGYHRHLALTEMGLTKIAVKIVDYTESEARIATISFNKIHGSTTEIGERRILDGHWNKDAENVSKMVMLDYVDLVSPEPEVDLAPTPTDFDAPISPNVVDINQGNTTQTDNTIDSKSNNNTDNKPEKEGALIAGPTPQSQPVKPEETFALPYFFKSSDYEYITDKCSTIRVRHKLENMADAFVYIFKIGEESIQHMEENKKLKAKLEKMEQLDQERKDKAEKRKQDKMVKELAKDREKRKKQEEKLAKEQLKQ